MAAACPPLLGMAPNNPTLLFTPLCLKAEIATAAVIIVLLDLLRTFSWSPKSSQLGAIELVEHLTDRGLRTKGTIQFLGAQGYVRTLCDGS